MQPSISLLALLATTLVITLNSVIGAPTTLPQTFPEIYFFEHENYEGRRFETVASGCLPLADGESDRFSSVRIPAGTCLKVFKSNDCRGPSRILESDHPDFGALGINDQVSSYRACTDSERSAKSLESTSDVVVLSPEGSTTVTVTSTSTSSFVSISTSSS